MRVGVVFAAVAALVWGAPASAQSITVSGGGTGKLGGTFPYFEPSMGVLDSVEIKGTLSEGAEVIRHTDTFPALSIPETITGGFFIDGPEFAETELTGFETYDEGTFFGSVDLSGSVSAILTGPDVNQFVDPADYKLGGIQALGGLAIHSYGEQIGPPGAFFSFTLTYNYHNYLPEPSTWVMMLLGFVGIGFALGGRQKGVRNPLMAAFRPWRTSALQVRAVLK